MLYCDVNQLHVKSGINRISIWSAQCLWRIQWFSKIICESSSNLFNSIQMVNSFIRRSSMMNANEWMISQMSLRSSTCFMLFMFVACVCSDVILWMLNKNQKLSPSQLNAMEFYIPNIFSLFLLLSQLNNFHTCQLMLDKSPFIFKRSMNSFEFLFWILIQSCVWTTQSNSLIDPIWHASWIV